MSVRDIEIKLVNGGGRTVCAFLKRSYCEDGEWTADDWVVAVKPASEKVLMHPNRPRPADKDTADRYLKQLPDGRRVLQVAGLTLRWEKVVPILDGLAEHNIATLTVDEFRQCIR